MASDDLQVARRFLNAPEAAPTTGDWDAVYSLLASDIEWVMPERTLSGLGEVRALEPTHRFGIATSAPAAGRAFRFRTAT